MTQFESLLLKTGVSTDELEIFRALARERKAPLWDVLLDEKRVSETLSFALRFLGVDVELDTPSRMLREALGKSS